MEENQIDNIREMLQVLVRRLGLLQREGSECCGVSMVQSHIIYIISKQPGLSQNTLADTLGLEKSTMSRHIQGLIKEGYVVSQSSAEDKRLLALNLTHKGEVMCQRITASMHDYIEFLFKQIPEGKTAQVIESLEILLDATGKSPFCCKGIL